MLAACLAYPLIPLAQAGHLGVSPVLLDVAAGNAITSVRVRNGDTAQAVQVQVRIMRWQQDETGDVYTPASGVVASPPVTRIEAGAENLVRIVRTATHALDGEESYRVLIDELPTPRAQQEGSGGGTAVRMLIRHVIPLFFAAGNATPAKVQWQIERSDNPAGYRVHAHNSGETRVRLVGLELHDAAGVLRARRDGLVGYALGRSHVSFVIPELASDGGAAATALRLSVRTETDPIKTDLLPVTGSP